MASAAGGVIVGNVPQSEVAYERLRDDIVNWRLEPGAPLSESETAARLGVSRTPVREAIRRLAQENLVQVIAGRGAFVASVSLSDVVELFQLRQALEPFAARLAASRPDNPELLVLLDRFERAPSELIEKDDRLAYYALCRDLDEAIGAMANNGRLLAALRSIWQEARRIRGISRSNQARLVETAAEHAAILRAVIAHDLEAAAETTRVHLENSLETILQSLRDPTSAAHASVTPAP